jgi:hypothetical protein
MIQGPAKRLHHLSFTLRAGSLDEVLGSLERAGTPLIEPPAGADEGGTWIRDPDGTAVQLLEAEPAPPRPRGVRSPQTLARGGSGTRCCSPPSQAS